MSRAVYQENKLKASFWAKDFSFSDRTLRGVVITVYGDDELPTAYFYVDTLVYTSEKDWEMKGGIQMSPANSDAKNGRSFVKFDSGWPSEIPKLDASPEALLAKILTDLDALPMEVMGKQIATLRVGHDQTSEVHSQIANLEFGYWNKIALPLAALIFGLVGAPIGIRSHRVPASAGYWIAVVIIIAYLVLARVMAIYAQGGRVPAIVASFLPIAIGLFAAGVLIHRRNDRS